MDKKITEIIDIVKRYLKEIEKDKIRISEAYLYGSYAQGTAREDSDIDVIVVSPDFTDSRFDNSVRLMKYRRGVDLRISPFGYRPENFTDNYLIPAEAKKSGIRIV